MELTSLIKKLSIINLPEQNLLFCVSTCCSNLSYNAIGGTRFASYKSLDEAINDSFKLAISMHIKCAVAKLNFVGGKVVVLKPSKAIDRRRFFSNYGQAVEELHGDIITGCDVGVMNSDMQIAAKHSQYITGLSDNTGLDYLAYLTALGVFNAAKLCYKKIKGIENFATAHVAVQGVGKVGYYFVQLLLSSGAQITIADQNNLNLARFRNHSRCRIVSVDEILKVECDIFSPCAMGEVINHNSLKQLRCSIICGAANNQLASESLLKIISAKNIFFIPDWICNIGGVIYAAESYNKTPIEGIKIKVERIILERVNEYIRYFKNNGIEKGYDMFIKSLNINAR